MHPIGVPNTVANTQHSHKAQIVVQYVHRLTHNLLRLTIITYAYRLSMSSNHNKKKAKIGQLTDDVKYFPGMEVDDVWLDYPWEVL